LWAGGQRIPQRIKHVRKRDYREVVGSGADTLVLIVQIIKRPKDQVDADNAKRLLLQDVLFIPHPDVQDNDARRRIWFRLVSDAHPALASLVPLKLLAATVSANTKKTVRPPRTAFQAFNQQIVLVVEHESQAFPGHGCILDRILQISPVTVLKKPLKVEQLNQSIMHALSVAWSVPFATPRSVSLGRISLVNESKPG
jgi:hypothetical protein